MRKGVTFQSPIYRLQSNSYLITYQDADPKSPIAPEGGIGRGGVGISLRSKCKKV